MTAKLVWNGDFSACGRFGINVERVRHGTTFESEFWLFISKNGRNAPYMQLAAGNRGDAKRMAQRLIDGGGWPSVMSSAPKWLQK